jgi:FAD/FMN-containing dehydrogenase
MTPAKLSAQDLCKALAEIVGLEYVTNEKFIIMAYISDFGGEQPSEILQLPDFIVRPGSAEEISKILKLANRFKVSVVPRGGATAQEGGCLPTRRHSIILETTRMDKILEINEDSGTVTVEGGIRFAKLDDALEKKGWKIGVTPSGALGGTVGAHVSKPALGWGNIKYGTQGDQVLGLKVVLPNGDLMSTGTGASPTAGQFSRYSFGPDLTGLFLGSEGALGIITEVTLKMYPYPEEIYIEKFSIPKLRDAIDAFREIIQKRLSFYISAFKIIPPSPYQVIFDIYIEGDKVEVAHYRKAVLKIIEKAHGESLGTEDSQKVWGMRFFAMGDEFKQGSAAVITYYLPFSKLEEATNVMQGIMKKHGLKKYSTEMFPMPNSSEHANLMFYYPDDREEYQKIRKAMDEMMRAALQMGGVPYTKGKQWGPFLEEHLKDTTYWKTLKAIKKLLDPNGIINPDVIGLK